MKPTTKPIPSVIHLPEHWNSLIRKDIQCLHLSCTQCKGTGIKANGGMCVHAMACSCPRCTVIC